MSISVPKHFGNLGLYACLEMQLLGFDDNVVSLPSFFHVSIILHVCFVCNYKDG